MNGLLFAEVWSRDVPDDRTRQIAAIGAFAAQGNLSQLKIHAGLSRHVTSGFSRATDGTQSLREVFAEHAGNSE